jgi:hypothetical protein
MYLCMYELGSFKAVAVSKETCQSPLCYSSFSRMSEMDISGIFHSHTDSVFQWVLFLNFVV